jgi:hypothetical protein
VTVGDSRFVRCGERAAANPPPPARGAELPQRTARRRTRRRLRSSGLAWANSNVVSESGLATLVRLVRRRRVTRFAGSSRRSNVACHGLTPGPGTAVQAVPGPGVDAGRWGRSNTGLHWISPIERPTQVAQRPPQRSGRLHRMGWCGWTLAGVWRARSRADVPRRASSATPSCYFADPVGATSCRGRLEMPGNGGIPEAGATGLEPATSGVTGRRSNQLSYAPGGGFTVSQA